MLLPPDERTDVPLLRIVELLLLLLRTAELLRVAGLLLRTAELLRVGVELGRVTVVLVERLLFVELLVRAGAAVARVALLLRVVLTLWLRDASRFTLVLTLPRVDVLATRSVVRTLVLPKVREALSVLRVDTRVVAPLPSVAMRVVPALRTAA